MELIFALVIVVVAIFLMRLFGAWMLRIDEVIKKLESIEQLLKKGLKKNIDEHE